MKLIKGKEIEGKQVTYQLANGGTTTYEYHAPIAAPTVATPPRIVTKLAFMNLFTNAELVAIYTAAKSSVAIEVWIKKLEAAKDVTLSNQATIDGVNALEAAKLIGVGRAARILA